jgi:predicted RNA binding protein YcfA (HicA-like mRNA interferase family)
MDHLVCELYNGVVKVRDLVRLVEADGWRHVRTTGSPRHYKHASKPNVVTIPGHAGDDLPTGTLKSILKAAGLEGKQ